MTGRRIRVAMVITRLNVGGPALHVLLLAQRLDPSRYAVTVFAGAPGESEGDMTGLLAGHQIRVVRIPDLRREITPMSDLRAFGALLAAMSRDRPDIVHTHMAKAGALGRIAGRAVGVRVLVHTFHGNVLRGYFGRWRSLLFRLAERVLGFMTTHVIVLSPRQADEIVRYGIVPRAKVAEIPLGIDLAPFADAPVGRLRSELGLAVDAELVGIVGRLVAIKGIDVFLDAARMVAEARPRAHFLIIGDGELRPQLEAQAMSLGLDSRVRFLGWRTDLPAIYADLDVVVLTSRNEGTPTSLIEAMAAARPIVATAVGGIPDLLPVGTGELVPPERPDEVARVTVELIRDRARARALGQAARRRALAESDAATLVSRIDALYRSLSHLRGSDR